MEMDWVNFDTNMGRPKIGLPSILKYFLLFFYVFDTHFVGIGLPTFITTRRLVSFAVLGLIFLTGRWPKALPRGESGKVYRGLVLLILSIFLYAGALRIGLGPGQGIHIFNNVTVFLFTGLLMTVGVWCLFDDFDDLMRGLIWICLAQVVIIVIFAMFPALQLRLDQIFGVELLNADLRWRGYMTGLSCSTSRGVLRLTLGMIACLYFLLKDRKHIAKYIVLFCLIGFVSTVLARTGLFVSGIGLVFVLFICAKRDGIALIKVLCLLGLLVGLFVGVIQVFQLADEMQLIFKRLIKLFNVGLYDGFFKAYFGQTEGSATVVPPLSFETMIGIGMTSGVSGNGITINVDGGYARMYAAIGLPMAIVFYTTLVVLMTKGILAIKNVTVRAIMLLLLVYIFAIGETKEYFLFEGYPIALFFGLLMLHDRDVGRDARLVDPEETEAVAE